MEVSGQLHAPAASFPGKNHGTHCLLGWVGPRAGLDAVTRNKTFQWPPKNITFCRCLITGTVFLPIIIIIGAS
jgi:hypothetical protein